MGWRSFASNWVIDCRFTHRHLQRQFHLIKALRLRNIPVKIQGVPTRRRNRQRSEAERSSSGQRYSTCTTSRRRRITFIPDASTCTCVMTFHQVTDLSAVLRTWNNCSIISFVCEPVMACRLMCIETDFLLLGGGMAWWQTPRNSCGN